MAKKAQKDKREVKTTGGLNRITEVLQQRGLPQSWLAEQMGVEVLTVNRWCTNYQQPKIKDLYEIAKILKVGSRDLLTF